MRHSHSIPGLFETRSLRLLLLGPLLGGLVFGCAQLRQATYPKDFVYLDRQQVQGQMARFSQYMRQIDDILLDDSTVSSEQQERVLAILTRIDESTVKLGAGSTRTNHLLIDEHIDQFRADVQIAIRDARADPPNYFALGRLSGSCVGCHKYRR